LFAERCHAAAYYLDPNYRNKTLPEESLLEAEELIKKYVPEAQVGDILAEVTRFRSRDGVYHSEIQDPILFWKRLRSLPKPGPLAEIALKILSLPMSCVAVERSFSVVRRIHTWQRNRLGRKKLAKLVYVYLNQRVLDKQTEFE
jgi:hypothetical protein